MTHYTQLRIDFAWNENAGYDEDRLLKLINIALFEQGLDMLGHDVESMDHAYTEEVRK